MKNLIQDTLNKIEKKHITPEPRWKFRLRKMGLWFLIWIIIFLGSASISVAYFLFAQLDWDLYNFTHRNGLWYMLSIVPYFWLVLLGLFILGIFMGVRKTEKGYRLNWKRIIMVTLLGIVLIGALLTWIGFDRRLNSAMMHNMPLYAKNIETKEKQWMRPTEGFLAGTIMAVSNERIALTDLENRTWQVQIQTETFISPRAKIKPREMIKLIGTQSEDGAFLATEIRPWEGMGRGMGTDRGGMMK